VLLLAVVALTITVLGSSANLVGKTVMLLIGVGAVLYTLRLYRKERDEERD
jgi:hypothetical protein